MSRHITMNNAARFGLVIGEDRTLRLRGAKPLAGRITDLIHDPGFADLDGVVLTDINGDQAFIPADSIAAVTVIH